MSPRILFNCFTVVSTWIPDVKHPHRLPDICCYTLIDGIFSSTNLLLSVSAAVDFIIMGVCQINPQNVNFDIEF